MTTHPIYTVGYLGWKQPKLIAALRRMTAMLVDIRFTPYSRNPLWRQGVLRDELGDLYVHIRALGNADHQSGGMRIMNYEAGKNFIATAAAIRPLILMCACKDREHCHRKVVGDMLIADGFDVRELEHPA